MNQGFQVSEAWQQKLGRTYKGTTRMAVCKEEVEQAIRELDPRTRINLVFFSDRVRVWQDVPQAAATAGDSAIGAVRALVPSGQTNHYDALRVILGLEDAESIARMDFPDTPDTLFFLTDGTPTDGEITKPDELLSWFRERNRFARLRVHVIAMGNTGIDIDYLRSLAQQNDGEFLHLTGSH
jgi:Mg-chelatase subunit ChlD